MGGWGFLRSRKDRFTNNTERFTGKKKKSHGKWKWTPVTQYGGGDSSYTNTEQDAASEKFPGVLRNDFVAWRIKTSSERIINTDCLRDYSQTNTELTSVGDGNTSAISRMIWTEYDERQTEVLKWKISCSDTLSGMGGWWQIWRDNQWKCSKWKTQTWKWWRIWRYYYVVLFFRPISDHCKVIVKHQGTSTSFGSVF